MFPSKPVVHVIEDSFLPTAQVIELYDIPYVGFEIIGKGRIGSCNWDKVALAVGIPASESDYYQHKPNFRNTFV